MFNNVDHAVYAKDLPICPRQVLPLAIATLKLCLKRMKIGRDRIKIPLVMTFIPSQSRNAIITTRNIDTTTSNTIPAKQPTGPASANAVVKAPPVSTAQRCSIPAFSSLKGFQSILKDSFLLTLTPLKTSKYI